MSQNIRLFKKANFLTDIHKKLEQNKFLNKYSSTLLQMSINSLFYHPILSTYLMLFCRDINFFFQHEALAWADFNYWLLDHFQVPCSHGMKVSAHFVQIVVKYLFG